MNNNGEKVVICPSKRRKRPSRNPSPYSNEIHGLSIVYRPDPQGRDLKASTLIRSRSQTDGAKTTQVPATNVDPAKAFNSDVSTERITDCKAGCASALENEQDAAPASSAWRPIDGKPARTSNPRGAIQNRQPKPEETASEEDDPAPIDDDPSISDVYKLAPIDLCMIHDPLCLQAVVKIWPGNESTGVGCHTSMYLELEDQLKPVTRILILAGHMLSLSQNLFQSEGWISQLRKAVKKVGRERVNQNDMRDAATWLLDAGLALDVDSIDFENVSRLKDRVAIVQTFLHEGFALKIPVFGDRSLMAFQAQAIAEIAAITLRPTPSSAKADDGWVPFPTELLPAVVAEFVDATAESKMVDPAMVALPALAILGAAIGTTRQIQGKPDWLEYPIVWSAVIASSGQRKTPVFSAVVEPLHDLQGIEDRRYRLEKANYDRQIREYDKKPSSSDSGNEVSIQAPGDPPVYNHVLTTDSTVESIGKILSITDRGILVAKDELSDFVGSFNSYKRSGNDHAKYLEFFNGKMVKIDRKTQDTLCILRGAVWITGAIQPAVFWESMSGHEEDGFLARFLLALPPNPRGGWSDAVVPPCVNQAWADVIRKLRGLNFLEQEAPENEFDTMSIPVIVTLTPETTQLLKLFCNSVDLRVSTSGDAMLSAAWRKMPGYVLKLALIIYLIEQPVLPEVTDQSTSQSTSETAHVQPAAVDSTVMQRAISLAEWFMHETRRVYTNRISMTSSAAIESNELVNYIKSKGGSIEVSLLIQNLRRFKKSRVLVKDALEDLVDQGLGNWTIRDKRFALIATA